MFLHLAAGVLAMGVLIGPTFLALADSPPLTTATAWTPLRLLAVRPFRDLSAGGCLPNPPIHAGPAAVQGTMIGRSELQNRMNFAMFGCAPSDWSGGVTVSATVDARGRIGDVRADGDASPAMQACLRRRIFWGEPIATRGPATLHAGYFMGQPLTGRARSFPQ